MFDQDSCVWSSRVYLQALAQQLNLWSVLIFRWLRSKCVLFLAAAPTMQPAAANVVATWLNRRQQLCRLVNSSSHVKSRRCTFLEQPMRNCYEHIQTAASKHIKHERNLNWLVSRWAAFRHVTVSKRDIQISLYFLCHVGEASPQLGPTSPACERASSECLANHKASAVLAEQAAKRASEKLVLQDLHGTK